MQRIRQMGLVIKSTIRVVILVVPHNDGRRSTQDHQTEQLRHPNRQTRRESLTQHNAAIFQTARSTASRQLQSRMRVVVVVAEGWSLGDPRGNVTGCGGRQRPKALLSQT